MTARIQAMTDTTPFEHRIAYLSQLALAALESYGGGFPDLERANRDLKSITRSLEEVAEPSWTQTWARQCFQLEMLYASMLHEQRSTLTQDEEDEVQAVVASLTAALHRGLGDKSNS
jgi:hypothetical protein